MKTLFTNESININKGFFWYVQNIVFNNPNYFYAENPKLCPKFKFKQKCLPESRDRIWWKEALCCV